MKAEGIGRSNMNDISAGTRAALPHAEPESVGVSSARLGRIISVLNAQVEAGQLPGAVIAIARHGRLIFHEAVGHLGPDQRTPMPRDALFAIASMTKPVTGVAGLLLWEEGRVRQPIRWSNSCRNSAIGAWRC
jgi:CubicO group peptidase (beta-lactamase class C family)